MTKQNMQSKTLKEKFEEIADIAATLKVSTNIDLLSEKFLIISKQIFERVSEQQLSSEELTEIAFKVSRTYGISYYLLNTYLQEILESIKNKKEMILSLSDIKNEYIKDEESGLYRYSEKDLRKRIKYSKNPMERRMLEKELNILLKNKKWRKQNEKNKC